MVGATFFGLSTLSYVAGTVSVLVASRMVRWGRIWRERRRIERLDALLSQVVVEIPLPGVRVRPNTGATPKRKPQDPKAAFVQLKRLSPPTRPSRSPQVAGRRLSDVWMEGDIVHVPQTEPAVRRGTRGRAPQGSLSVDSLDSFKSIK